MKINLKFWKQPISHPMQLWSSIFKVRLIPVIYRCKTFTYSLPLEPSKHKLALYKSVRAAELSIIQSLDLHIPDGRLEVCGEASCSTPSICPLSCFSLMEIPLVFGGKKTKKKKPNNFELCNTQTKTQKKSKCWLLGRTCPQMTWHAICFIQTVSGPNTIL